MTEEEIRNLLPQAERLGLKQRWQGNSLSLWTQLGILDPAYLHLELHEGRLVHASISDGKGERLKDAPADF